MVQTTIRRDGGTYNVHFYTEEFGWVSAKIPALPNGEPDLEDGQKLKIWQDAEAAMHEEEIEMFRRG